MTRPAGATFSAKSRVCPPAPTVQSTITCPGRGSRSRRIASGRTGVCNGWDIKKRGSRDSSIPTSTLHIIRGGGPPRVHFKGLSANLDGLGDRSRNGSPWGSAHPLGHDKPLVGVSEPTFFLAIADQLVNAG